MKNALLLCILMFIGFSAFGQGKKDTCRLTIVDTNPKWTEKYFRWPMIHSFPRKSLRLLYDWSESRSDSNFLTFIARKGKFQLYFISREVSNFKDTLFFDINLQNDTTIYFQDFTEGFYEELDSSQTIFANTTMLFDSIEDNINIIAYPGEFLEATCLLGGIQIYRINIMSNSKSLKIRSYEFYKTHKIKKPSDHMTMSHHLFDFERACKRLGKGYQKEYQRTFDLTIYYNRKIAYFKGKAASEADEELLLNFIRNYSGIQFP